MFAEAKLEVQYRVIRSCFENRLFGPKVNLSIVEGATLDGARESDHKERDFAKSATLYWSVLERSQDADEQAWAFGGLVLQLTNARAFRQARELLNSRLPLLLESTPKDKRYFLEADAGEKQGRVEYSERGYRQAAECFQSVGEILERRGRERWTLGDQKAFSTARHFLGKLELDLAVRGVDKENNLQNSRENLKEAIELDKKIRGSGVEETVGYGYLELARNYLVSGNLNEAEETIEEARQHFEAYIETTPGSTIMDSYHPLKALIDRQILLKKSR